MKQVTKLLMISWTLFALVNCSASAPKRPENIRRGVLIDNGTPYIRYENTDKPSQRWNLLIDESQSLNHVCTYKDDYVKMWSYGEQLKEYVLRIEKDLQKCRGR